MTEGPRSYLGAMTLTREKQLVILVFSLCLTGLWAWRAGFFCRQIPPTAAIHHYSFIEIIGNIPSPGLYVLSSSPTFQRVWEAAGGRGTLPHAGQLMHSGAKVAVAADGTISLARMSGADLLTLGLAVDLNWATAEDLAAIPGLGSVLANRIVEFRGEQGRFHSHGDLQKVKGIGPAKLESIRPYLEIIIIGSEPNIKNN